MAPGGQAAGSPGDSAPGRHSRNAAYGSKTDQRSVQLMMAARVPQHRSVGLALSLLALAGCTLQTPPVQPPSPPTAAPPAHYTYRVIQTYPHDPTAFTQGLVFHQGALYEGTGLVGESTLRKVELESGVVLDRLTLPPEQFGEGIAILGERIVQLTLNSG